MSCNNNRGGFLGFGGDWIWIIIAIVVVLCLCNDGGGLFGGNDSCDPCC